MSFAATRHVWSNTQHSGTELVVLLALAHMADESGTCYPSIRHLAEMARVSMRAVQRALRSLEQSGEIERSERWNTSNLYTVKMVSVAQEKLPGDEYDTPDEYDTRGASNLSVETPVTNMTPLTNTTPGERQICRGAGDEYDTGLVTTTTPRIIIESPEESSKESEVLFASSPDDAHRRFFDALAFSQVVDALVRQALDQERAEQDADALRKQQNAAVASIIAAWVKTNNIIVVQTDKRNNPYQNMTNRESALALHQAGVTAEDVRDFITERKQDDYWKTKTMPFSTILKDIASWKTVQQPAPVPVNDDWDTAFDDDDEDPNDPRIPMPDYVKAKWDNFYAAQEELDRKLYAEVERREAAATW